MVRRAQGERINPPHSYLSRKGREDFGRLIPCTPFPERVRDKFRKGGIPGFLLKAGMTRRATQWVAPTACCAATIDFGTDGGVCPTDYGSISIMGGGSRTAPTFWGTKSCAPTVGFYIFPLVLGTSLPTLSSILVATSRERPSALNSASTL